MQVRQMYPNNMPFWGQPEMCQQYSYAVQISVALFMPHRYAAIAHGVSLVMARNWSLVDIGAHSTRTLTKSVLALIPVVSDARALDLQHCGSSTSCLVLHALATYCLERH